MSWLTGDLVIVPLSGAVSTLASSTAELVVCDQNTHEWYEARNGMPTGSAASKIITPTGKPRAGKAVDKFAFELAMDRVYGRDLEQYVSPAMELGHAIEPESRRAWESKSGVKVEQVGFVYGDSSRSYGCSPDGLFVRDGRLGVWETKARQRSAMCEVLADGENHEIPKAHYTDLQFNMWVCGATIGVYVEYFSSGILPLLVEVEVGVDENLFSGFEAAISSFCDLVNNSEETIRGMSAVDAIRSTE